MKKSPPGGRSVAEAGPEVIEALLLESGLNGQGPKSPKELERPEMSTRIDKMSTNWGWLKFM